MKIARLKMTLSLAATAGFASSLLLAGEPQVRPVTPEAAPEAVELLKFIYQLSGKQTLSGQHNFPGDKDKQTVRAAKAWGKVPAIFGKDWGFAKQGDQDSAFVRDETVEVLKQQYQRGSLVTLCWHEVPPTADEPVEFRMWRRGTNSFVGFNLGRLNTIQGQLSESQYRELLTPGTELHQRWCAQVDAVVPYFKTLADAHVPVLWRPFHEMNGNWFWWGGRRGQYGTTALYKMMFDWLVNHHKLRNLIWVWSVDRPEGKSLKFEECWPGPEYVDILSLDCYGEFKQSYYDDLLKLANGKPIALAEVGSNLNLAALQAQPHWAWWMGWPGTGVRGESTNRFPAILKEPRVWSLSDSEYRTAIAPIRAASGFLGDAPAPPAP